MIAVYTLFSSLFLIALLFLFKYFELKSGKLFFKEFRARADTLITDHLPHIHERTLRTSKELSHHAAMSGLHYMTLSLLRVVRVIERRLAYVVSMIRGRRKVVRNGNASSFLMKVSEHKKVNGTKQNRFSKDAQ